MKGFNGSFSAIDTTDIPAEMRFKRQRTNYQNIRIIAFLLHISFFFRNFAAHFQF